LGQEAKTWVKSIKENEVTVEIRAIRKMHFDQKKKIKQDGKKELVSFSVGIINIF
jgi:hypothetical protein